MTKQEREKKKRTPILFEHIDNYTILENIKYDLLSHIYSHTFMIFFRIKMIKNAINQSWLVGLKWVKLVFSWSSGWLKMV